jgi:hypothetical protein
MNAETQRTQRGPGEKSLSRLSPRFSSSVFSASLRSICIFVILFCLPLSKAQTSSALIGHALDAQISDLSADGGLLDVMKAVENQTGIRIEASDAVWDALPWGQDTHIGFHVQNVTARQVLDAITQKLGLVWSLGSEAVEFSPSPPLARLGRRATLDEIDVLALMSKTPADLPASQLSLQDLLHDIDGKLSDAKSPFAIQQRGLDSNELQQSINVARNASLMEAMSEIPQQTDATWYPWGKRLVMTKKIDAVRMLLGKTVNMRFRHESLEQMLKDLSQESGVDFIFGPGTLDKVPSSKQMPDADLSGQSVKEALQFLTALTNLNFTVTADGVFVSYVGPATQP